MTRAKTQRPKSRAPTINKRRAHSVVDEQLVEVTELPEVPTLKIAVHETAAFVAAAEHAIVAAGHVSAKSASGREGIAEIQVMMTNGQIDVVLVGLPGGEPIIDAALALSPRSPVIIAASSGTTKEAIVRANASGADLATARPHDFDKLAPMLLAAARLLDHRRELTTARGSEAVLRARLDNLTDSDGSGLQSFEMFQRILELELKRARRYLYPLSVALFALELPPAPPGVRGILRARAGNALVHTIRDIDLATELDQERFLVLLPYTDLIGATELARRVLAAVAGGDPVVARGRAFAPQLKGAVTGAKPGQQLSFAKLMRDAMRALEQARSDGAELAIQP
ncbi:hypothetical protein BH11MYX3_BH11MYX3_08460 [soil metagenome]